MTVLPYATPCTPEYVEFDMNFEGRFLTHERTMSDKGQLYFTKV